MIHKGHGTAAASTGVDPMGNIGSTASINITLS